MIARRFACIALSLGMLVLPAASAASQVRPTQAGKPPAKAPAKAPPAKAPPAKAPAAKALAAKAPAAKAPAAKAPAPPALSVKLLTVGMVDGRSAAGQRPYGPKASAIVVEIGAPVAGLTARVDRATTTVTVGGTPLPASYAFVVGGDTAIVDGTVTYDPVAWETIVGTETRRPLGSVVRSVVDLRKGDWVEYRFTRPGNLQLAVVFDDDPSAFTSAVIAGQTFDVARTRLGLVGLWEGAFAWRGVTGQLRFAVDSGAAEVTDLDIGFTCTDSASRRQGAPNGAPDIRMNIPTPLAWIRANGTFSFASDATHLQGTGRFVTADSAAGTLTGTDMLGCPGGPRVALKGPWVAKRTTQPLPPRAPYTFRVDSAIASFAVSNAVQSCGYRSSADTADLVMEPSPGGTTVKASGTLPIIGGKFCIWLGGAVYKWIGTHDAVGTWIRSIRGIRSDSTAPLRFTLSGSDYVYVSGRGTLTMWDGKVYELPQHGGQLISDEPEVTTTRWPEERAVDLRNVRAAEVAQRACDGGEMAGCLTLGRAYAEGRGVRRNYNRSVELYRKACDGGDMDGCAVLGWAHSESLGSGYINRAVVRQAVDFYRKACDGGSVEGCLRLGNAYSWGRDVPPDLARAVQLYQRACDARLMSACRELASAYSNGTGVPQNKQRAAELYRQACEDGDLNACGRVGGVAEEVELYRKLCDSGKMDACSRLSQAYEEGRGVPKDVARGVELDRQACDRDPRYGCYALGWRSDPAHESTLGLPQSDTLAVQFYRRACNGEVMEACYNLSQAYAKGRGGLRQNEARAADLLQRACNGARSLSTVTDCDPARARWRP